MKRGTEKHATLVIHIGSASVGAGIVRDHARDAAELSQVTRIPFPSADGGADALEAAMKDALAKLLAGYAPGGAAQYAGRDIRIVVSAPWHHGRIRTVVAASEKPTALTMRSAERMVETYKDETPPETGRTDLEAAAFEIKVNGYPTALMGAVEGASIRVNLYESEMDVRVKSAIADAVMKAFPHAAASYHSLPLAAAAGLRTVADGAFTLVDIGGAITELAIVNGSIEYLASFPQGSATMLAAMKSAGVADAPTRLALLARGELSEADAAALADKAVPAFAPWQEAFKNALKAASDTTSIPRTLYVIAEAADLPWVMGRIVPSEPTLFAAAADAGLFQSLVAMGEDGAYDPAIAAAALFFHIEPRDRVVYSRQ